MNGRNKITVINTGAAAIFRYGAGIFDLKGCELKRLDRTAREIKAMYGAFHPKSNVNRLYLKRHEGGRGLISIEHCVRKEENNLGLYVMNSAEKKFRGFVHQGQLRQKVLSGKSEFERQCT